jgi:hypothetical protein
MGDAMSWGNSAAHADNADRIRPYAKKPYYWQYKGKPVLPLGGSWQDSLFNHPTGLAEHLDLLVECGGNYVRNTMSTREKEDVFPYAKREGKFDLNQWNDEYWRRLDDFLRMTYEQDIIVRIEVFDTWDFYAWCGMPKRSAAMVLPDLDMATLRLAMPPGRGRKGHNCRKSDVGR